MPNTDTPDPLRPYIFCGVDLQWRRGDKEATAECPFCNRDGKFSVNLQSGQYQCWGCRSGTSKGGGNSLVFVRMLHEVSYKETTTSAYQELCHDRGLLFEETPIQWQLAKSTLDGNWIVPGFNSKKELVTLYSRRNKLYPVPELGSAIFGANLYTNKKETVFLAEGPWDAMAFWEVLGRANWDDDREKLKGTSSVSSSLLSGANVLAVPGCGAIGKPFKKWTSLFKDKEVILLFDNDHEKESQGKIVPSAALEATKRAASMLEGVADSISYLEWGPEGWSKDYPHNYDIRDEICYA